MMIRNGNNDVVDVLVRYVLLFASNNKKTDENQAGSIVKNDIFKVGSNDWAVIMPILLTLISI